MESHYLQRDHQGFLKDVEVRFIDKTQASDTTERKFYWMRILRTLYLDGRNIEGDYLGTAEDDFKQTFYNHRMPFNNEGATQQTKSFRNLLEK